MEQWVEAGGVGGKAGKEGGHHTVWSSCYQEELRRFQSSMTIC